MSKFTHTFDVSFQVKSDSDNPDHIQSNELLAGMAVKLSELMTEELDTSVDVTEYFGYLDTGEL